MAGRPNLSKADLSAIAIGGVLGASLRWLITRQQGTVDGGWFEYAPNTSVALEPVFSFPAGTLIVNVLGCLLLGAFAFLLARASVEGDRRLLLAGATGFCGSLTTFSTFAVEIAERLRGPVIPRRSEGLNLRYDADPSGVITYLGVSLIAGGLAFALGRLAARRVLSTPDSSSP